MAVDLEAVVDRIVAEIEAVAYRCYYVANREELLEKNRQWREAHREERMEYHLRYDTENRDARHEKDRRYNEANRESINEKHRRHYRENAKTENERNRRYQETHREAITAQQRVRRATRKAAALVTAVTS